jgi:predicted metal-dependent RNase
MTTPAIPPKPFLKAMTLPDDQRRKMLEKLGAKMMRQLKTERNAVQQSALGGKLVGKNV